jgi:cyclopropane fatty-acyl-phospholipid synthase-like methyltransferase
MTPPAEAITLKTMPHTSSWRETLAYLNWLFNPRQRLDTEAVYDLLSTRALTEQGLYLNLGYWAEAKDLDAASTALVDLVAEQARLGPDDTLLDVGFGFGDQDMHWLSTYDPARIIGLNITRSQVQVARERVAERGMSDRIDLREGSATEIDLPDASVDKVVALECAFHFRTRERFFGEAFRVLKPGGRLAVADILPMPRKPSGMPRLQQRVSWALVASRFAIPPENVYPIPTYHAKLKLAGFDTREVHSIRDRVYAPLHHWLDTHRSALKRLHPAARLAARLGLARRAESVYAGLDYVMATAVKPLGAPRR